MGLDPGPTVAHEVVAEYEPRAVGWLGEPLKTKESTIMAQAIWNGTVLAESDETVVVEGNHYFPPDSLKREYFAESSRHTTCPWKGVASYYDLEVDGQRNPNAAWYYPSPSAAAADIKDHVAFYGSVRIST